MMKKKVFVVGFVFIGIIILLMYHYSNSAITQEKVIAEFNSDSYYFNVIKEYLLTQPKDYYINTKTYSADIKDIQVVQAVNYLVHNLNYKRIYTHGEPQNNEDYYIIFVKSGNNNDEFGIIYTHSKVDYGMTMEQITNNWYFHWMGYGY